MLLVRFLTLDGVYCLIWRLFPADKRPGWGVALQPEQTGGLCGLKHTYHPYRLKYPWLPCKIPSLHVPNPKTWGRVKEISVLGPGKNCAFFRTPPPPPLRGYPPKKKPYAVTRNFFSTPPPRPCVGKDNSLVFSHKIPRHWALLVERTVRQLEPGRVAPRAPPTKLSWVVNNSREAVPAKQSPHWLR